MNTRAFIRTLSVLLILCLAVLLDGCFDMGGFNNGEQVDDTLELSDHDFLEYYKMFYDTFDDIYLVKQDCSSNKYRIAESFFNKECVNNTRLWDKSPFCVSYEEYCYLSVKLKRDIKIDSLSLYIKGKDLSEETNLKFYFFIVDSFNPEDDFRTYDKWQEELNKDESERKEISDYKDLDITTAYKERNISINNYGWNSFTIGFLEKGSDELTTPYEFHKDEYIVIMFVNNTGIGLDLGLNKIKLSATNFIVRANESKNK